MLKLKNLLLTFTLLALVFQAFPQIPAGYYSAAEGLSGESLKNALHNIIRTHNSVSYSDLWQSFQTTDRRTDNDKVWDIYSDNPNGVTGYYFTFGDDKCGTYSGEGDCYNREHSVPKSWFGGSVAPMYTDLFHLYPTDGYVNSKRSNLPLGEVSSATWTSTNGSKVGLCSYPGYSGTVFEPNDSYKGDLARTYLYMAVRYSDRNLGAETQSMFSYSSGNCTLKPWAIAMFLKWCAEDPVSQKEIDRNNAVYNIQHNRNPFIDYPELAEMIFGDGSDITFTTGLSSPVKNQFLIFPNPTQSKITIQHFDNKLYSIQIINIMGVAVQEEKNIADSSHDIDITHLSSGVYILRTESENHIFVQKIVKK